MKRCGKEQAEATRLAAEVAREKAEIAEKQRSVANNARALSSLRGSVSQNARFPATRPAKHGNSRVREIVTSYWVSFFLTKWTLFTYEKGIMGESKMGHGMRQFPTDFGAVGKPLVSQRHQNHENSLGIDPVQRVLPFENE